MVYLGRFHWSYTEFESQFRHKTSPSRGGSPGLVVLGVDSCSKGRQFETRHRLLDGHFSHFLLQKM